MILVALDQRDQTLTIGFQAWMIHLMLIGPSLNDIDDEAWAIWMPQRTQTYRWISQLRLPLNLNQDPTTSSHLTPINGLPPLTRSGTALVAFIPHTHQPPR